MKDRRSAPSVGPGSCTLLRRFLWSLWHPWCIRSRLGTGIPVLGHVADQVAQRSDLFGLVEEVLVIDPQVARSLAVRRRAVVCEDHGSDGGMGLSHGLHHLEAVAVAQYEIHDDDIGIERANLLDGRAGIAAIADDAHAEITAQHA